MFTLTQKEYDNLLKNSGGICRNCRCSQYGVDRFAFCEDCGERAVISVLELDDCSLLEVLPY